MLNFICFVVVVINTIRNWNSKLKLKIEQDVKFMMIDEDRWIIYIKNRIVDF